MKRTMRSPSRRDGSFNISVAPLAEGNALDPGLVAELADRLEFVIDLVDRHIAHETDAAANEPENVSGGVGWVGHRVAPVAHKHVLGRGGLGCQAAWALATISF